MRFFSRAHHEVNSLKTVSNWEKFLHPRGRMDVRVQIKSEISYDFDLRKKIVYIFVSD